jgi:anti-sigma-K factor RskA
MTHEEYREMLAEHALGALAADEARALETHLAMCAECRAELAAWLDTSSALAFATPLVEPPAALRSRLLETVRSMKPDSTNEATKRSERATEEVSKQASPAATNVIQMPERKRSSWSAMQRFGALAASLAFAAFIIALVVLWNRNRAMEMESARLTRELQTAQEQLKSEQEKSEMLVAQDTRSTTLNGTQMAPRAHARLFYNKAGKAMMVADELPPAPAGKDYQIWFIANGKPMPGGVFKPDAKGHVEMHAEIPAQARGASAFAITLEPQGGTSAPTGEMYLKGDA